MACYRRNTLRDPHRRRDTDSTRIDVSRAWTARSRSIANYTTGDKHAVANDGKAGVTYQSSAGGGRICCADGTANGSCRGGAWLLLKEHAQNESVGAVQIGLVEEWVVAI